MIPFESLITFIGTATLLALVPGPDNLFVLTQSVLFGRSVGIYITLGLCVGLVFHTIAVSLGVAAVFQTSKAAFTGLKFVGATYLLYLAYKSFQAKPDEIGSTKETSKPALKMFVRGIVMNVTNPKVAIFFLAFLPQFASPDRGSIAVQILILGVAFIACAFTSFASISMLAGSLSIWLRKSSTGQVNLNRIAGTVFVGLAMKLALAQK